MKLYNGMSPNGSRVSIFLAEKGVDVPTQDISVISGETRSEAFLQINSLGQVPVLELDDGRMLTESIAICRYLESRYPQPSLFGQTTEEQAFIEMWTRRMELYLFNTIGDVGLHEFEFFKDKVDQNKVYAESQRKEFGHRLAWLDKELDDGRPFIAGNSFSIADIVGMSMFLVTALAGYTISPDFANVKKWESAMRERANFPQTAN